MHLNGENRKMLFNGRNLLRISKWTEDLRKIIIIIIIKIVCQVIAIHLYPGSQVSIYMTIGPLVIGCVINLFSYVPFFYSYRKSRTVFRLLFLLHDIQMSRPFCSAI